MDEASEAFDEWWEHTGARFSCSLIVATENATVRHKLRVVWIDAWMQSRRDRAQSEEAASLLSE